MRFLLRLLGAAVLLLSVVVFVGCVSGVAGAWVLRQKVSAKADDLAGRLEPGLRRASDAAEGVRRSVKTVHADVDLVVRSPEALEAGGDKNRLVVAYFRTVVQRLKAFSVAETTAASLLRGFQGLPLGEGGIDPETLDRAARKAEQLSASLEKLQATLGEGDYEVPETDVASAARELDQDLRGCDETIDEWQADLGAVRAALPRLQARVRAWLTLAAVAVTAVGAWVAVSQISLFAQGWKWCRRG